MPFKDIFRKSNDFNEKTIIGFLSFIVMVITLFADIIAGWTGIELPLHDFIFEAFMWIIIGSFFPDVIEKFAFINRKKDNLINTEPKE